MKTVIMAGGKGTRIASMVSDIPKPMIKINNKPVLEYQIECLREQGFNDIIITVSYLGDIIINYFGDGSKISPITGKPFGVHIEYFYEKEPLGNAGALFKIKDKLTEDFLLINGDVIYDIDCKRFVEFHKAHGGWVTLFTHPNSHPYDSGLIITDDKGIVQKWLNKEDKRPIYYKNRVNAGLHIISPKILEMNFQNKEIDLDRQILRPLEKTGKMFAYDSPEYVKDMGTTERYLIVEEDLKKGIVARKNLQNKQKAIFLDRDGIINKYISFLKNIDDFELISGVDKAIKKINESGYLAIIVTNQSVVARGELTIEQLKEIHNKMETLLGNNGAYLDAIYYCPHHPDKGFVGEVGKLKVNCNCRKPKPGLLLKAAKKFNIDLKKSWMIGDSQSDILAGKNSGCSTAYVGISNEDYGADICADNLNNIIDRILERREGK